MHKKYLRFGWILVHWKSAVGIVPVRLGVSTSLRICGDGENTSTVLTTCTVACNVYAVHTDWLLDLSWQIDAFLEFIESQLGCLACYAQMTVVASAPNGSVDTATRMAPLRLSSGLLRNQRSSVVHFQQLMCCVIVAIVLISRNLNVNSVQATLTSDIRRGHVLCCRRSSMFVERPKQVPASVNLQRFAIELRANTAIHEP
jgi:hypothetical protein